MKRSWKLLLALAVMLMMIFAVSTASADTVRFGTVKGGTTNLREGMSTSTRKLGAYPTGTWMRITGESNGWYKVTAPDGMSGYMKKDFVYISASAKGIVGIVDVQGELNMRASASSTARVTGTYPDGVPCILLSEQSGWYHVTVDGKAGYFDADFIDKKYMTYSPDVATVVTANGGGLNLRKGPGTSYGVVKSIKNGSYVMIIQEGRDWWKVSVNGSVGFVDTDFIRDGIVRKTTSSSGSSSAGSTGAKPSGGSGYAVVNNPGANERLNLRQSASRSSRSLAKYGNGTYVTVLEQGNVWCKVQVEGKTGYMMTAYLKFYGLSGASTALVDHPDRTFVYFRSSPSQSAGNILMKVPHGARVTILTPGGTWSKITYNGKTGYMMTRFLDK
ncbi:MAG: SH3 domain-containing protein [Clostridia bacterium]|nr:SH3 domain-containing protein [Clostridia bacterium]